MIKTLESSSFILQVCVSQCRFLGQVNRFNSRPRLILQCEIMQKVDTVLHELTASGWERLTSPVRIEWWTQRRTRSSIAKKPLVIFKSCHWRFVYCNRLTEKY